MNHDYTFCNDFGPECPESCFRAEITAVETAAEAEYDNN